MNGGERGIGEKENGAMHSAAGNNFSAAPFPLCSPAHYFRRTPLLQRLLAWLLPQSPVRRYRVTPRHNAYAFRRALLREALRELKRDPAFATLPARRHT